MIPIEQLRSELEEIFKVAATGFMEFIEGTVNIESTEVVFKPESKTQFFSDKLIPANPIMPVRIAQDGYQPERFPRFQPRELSRGTTYFKGCVLDLVFELAFRTKEDRAATLKTVIEKVKQALKYFKNEIELDVCIQRIHRSLKRRSSHLWANFQVTLFVADTTEIEKYPFSMEFRRDILRRLLEVKFPTTVLPIVKAEYSYLDCYLNVQVDTLDGKRTPISPEYAEIIAGILINEAEQRQLNIELSSLSYCGKSFSFLCKP